MKNTGFSGDTAIFRKLGDFLGEAIYVLCGGAGTLLLTLRVRANATYDFNEQWQQAGSVVARAWAVFTNPTFQLVVGVILFIVGLVGNYFDQKSLKREKESLVRDNEKIEAAQSSMDAAQEQVQDLASQLQRLNIDLVQTWLKSLSDNFGLDTNDRITVYYEHGRAFFLLARYSKNPEFRRIHRQKFPIDEGVISQAWQHDECFETECPQFTLSSQYYEDFLVEKYGYDREKPLSFNMKSCRLYAKAIIDAGDNIGVIVFESTSDQFFEKLDVEALQLHCKSQQGQLAKFVRDGLKYDKEITLLNSARTTSVESELLAGASHE